MGQYAAARDGQVPQMLTCLKLLGQQNGAPYVALLAQVILSEANRDGLSSHLCPILLIDTFLIIICQSHIKVYEWHEIHIPSVMHIKRCIRCSSSYCSNAECVICWLHNSFKDTYLSWLV
jgi:hypothetical protein